MMEAAEHARRILFACDGHYLSHTTRPLEIARRLRERGHDVHFAASGGWTRLIDEAGFPRVELVTPTPEHIMSYTRASRMDYYAGQLLSDCVESDLQALAATRPDVVVGDFRWTLSISSEVAGIPYASILNTLWTHHYAIRRSVPEGFALRRYLGERFVQTIGTPLKELLLWIWGQQWNVERRRRGLRPRRNLNWHFYGDLDILPDLESLFPTKPLPPHVRRVGPIFWKDGVTSEPERLPPARSRPLVYASIGSTGTDLFLQRLFEGFGSADVDVVMTTGGQPLPCPAPANFHCLDLVAPADVLPRAVLAVCHGGNGTVYQCLSYGVPLLGMATHNDQQWNLDRVAACGLGWRFTQEQVTPADLRNCLDAVLLQPRWRHDAARIQEEIAATDGPGEAAAAIEALLP